MTSPYKQVLMVGATSGIGAAMADKLVQEGAKVIAVGRRQDRLDAFVEKHGKENTSAVQFDLSDPKNTDQFVKDITSKYPDLDCLFLNAGRQTVFDFTDPEKIDLSAFHAEMALNFGSFVDLTVKFLPFFKAKESATSIIYTGSNIAFVPAFHAAAYCASKSALNVFIMCLREQIKESSIKIIEIAPPVVQTEIHDYMGKERGRAMGMPVDAFTNEAYEGLLSGKEFFFVGQAPPGLHEYVEKRSEVFDMMSNMVRSHR